MIQIGKYTPARNGREALIQREFYGEGFEPKGFESRFATADGSNRRFEARHPWGYIVKDEAAYLSHPDQVCYVPELSDAAYTHNDLLAMCDGQEALARLCFDCVNWQSPETWVDEQFICGEWVYCDACGRVYDCDDNVACPHCKGGHAE